MARREHPRYETTEWPDYEFQEYPMMVYPGSKDGGKTPDPNPRHDPGNTRSNPFLQEGVVVKDDNELRAALNIDASDDTKLVSTGLNGPKRLRNVDDERDELLAEADALGVQVDKRWGPDKIRDAIAAFKEDVPV